MLENTYVHEAMVWLTFRNRTQLQILVCKIIYNYRNRNARNTIRVSWYSLFNQISFLSYRLGVVHVSPDQNMQCDRHESYLFYSLWWTLYSLVFSRLISFAVYLVHICVYMYIIISYQH